MGTNGSGPSLFELQAKEEALQQILPEDLGLRVHRALSWLNRAQQFQDDNDLAFICYWIAFNAAYADELNDTTVHGERSAFLKYFEQLAKLDQKSRIYDVVWNQFSQPVRVLLENQFVFQPFWKNQNGTPSYENWADRLQKSKIVINKALAKKDTPKILALLFDRMYVLRNQLIHGGATWQSSVNRNQVRDGCNIIERLIPLFIDLMMDAPHISWGKAYYPVIKPD